MKYKEVAKQVIINHLGAEPNGYDLSVILELKKGNDELLLDHIKALRDILNKAIEYMEDK